MRYCDQTFDPEFIIDFPTGCRNVPDLRTRKVVFQHTLPRIGDIGGRRRRPSRCSRRPKGDSATTSTDILARIAEAQNKEKAESQRSTLSQSTAVYHTIRSGDMLGKLAIKYGVSIDQICRLNKISRTTILQLGRKLRIK